MARLYNLLTKQFVYLKHHHTFGRYKGFVDSHISSPEVSKIHASISWNSGDWQIRDLSRNGTWLDGVKIPLSKNMNLSEGQNICFADSEKPYFQISDLSAPQNLLIGLNTNSETVSLSQYHLLPNEKKPEIALYQDKQQQWVLESLKELVDSDQKLQLKEIRDGDVLELDHFRWQVFLAGSNDETHEIKTKKNMSDCQFLFNVSLNEEHINLSIEHDNHRVNFFERSHHYILLHLLRAKKLDQKKGLDFDSQGWMNIEILAKELGMEASHINIHVFRIRKQMVELMPDVEALEQIVERRRGALRCNCVKAQIKKGGNTEIIDLKI